MKLNTIILAGLAAGVSSLPAVLAVLSSFLLHRGPDVLENGLEAVIQGITNLNAAITAYDYDASPGNDAADLLIQAINDDNAIVDGSDSFSYMQVVNFAVRVNDLVAEVVALEANLNQRKSDIEEDGLCDNVREKLETINSDATALINSIISKVPPLGQSIAKPLASSITDAIGRAQSGFSVENCT